MENQKVRMTAPQNLPMAEQIAGQECDTQCDVVQLYKAIKETKKDETVLLGEKEAAEFFGLRPQTLALWRHQSKGPAYIKLGSSVRYEP